MYVHYSYDQLLRFCVDVFLKTGYSKRNTEFITDTLLTADLYGIESHGMNRIVGYHKLIANGGIKIDAQPTIEFETPVSAVINGNCAMGQLVSRFAMNTAINKAKSLGISIVTVHSSNHFGIAGYYTKMASDEGLMGFAFTNSEAIMVPTNGKKAMIGSSPIAMSFPAEPYDFMFDASTAVVTRGMLEVYNKNGKTSNEAGRAVENIVAKRGGEGEMTGGHECCGCGIICEIFSSILSGGPTSNRKGKLGQSSHGFIAIDPKIFGDPEIIKKRFSDFLEELRSSPVADGKEKIYTHGEKEMLSAEKRMKEGFDVNINTVAEMKDLCEHIGLDPKEYLGDVDASNTTKSSYI